MNTKAMTKALSPFKKGLTPKHLKYYFNKNNNKINIKVLGSSPFFKRA
jgi:hypothetical protein